MTARFIIFLYPEHIGGYELLGKQCQWISVDGMREMRCHSASDVDSYVERILDTYNLEDLSELNAHYILIDAGSTFEVKERAVKVFRKNHVDLVTVDTLLPFLIMSNQDLAPGGTVRAHMGGAFADSWFKCVVEQDGTVIAQRDTSGSSAVEVGEEDFATFALPNAESFNGKQEWIKNLESEQKRAQKNELDLKAENQRLQKKYKCVQEKYAFDVSKLKDEQVKAQEKYTFDISRLKDELVKNQEKYASDVSRIKDEIAQKQKNDHHQIKVGQIIYLGRNRGYNISWRIIACQESKALLFCNTSVCHRPFSTRYFYWANCDLRFWLNRSFIDNFTSDEKEMILNTNHDGITDKIFLLSNEEIIYYLNNKQERAYGEWWWLRTQGSYLCNIAGVNVDGLLDMGGCSADTSRAVRPALWIDIALYISKNSF